MHAYILFFVFDSSSSSTYRFNYVIDDLVIMCIMTCFLPVPLLCLYKVSQPVCSELAHVSSVPTMFISCTCIRMYVCMYVGEGINPVRSSDEEND